MIETETNDTKEFKVKVASDSHLGTYYFDFVFIKTSDKDSAKLVITEKYNGLLAKTNTETLVIPKNNMKDFLKGFAKILKIIESEDI